MKAMGQGNGLDLVVFVQRSDDLGVFDCICTLVILYMYK